MDGGEQKKQTNVHSVYTANPSGAPQKRGTSQGHRALWQESVHLDTIPSIINARRNFGGPDSQGPSETELYAHRTIPCTRKT